MNSDVFELDPSLPDVAQVVDDIHRRVATDIQEGRYDDARIGVAERSNLASIRQEDQFVAYYLRCLHNGATVDINDFEITHDSGGFKGKIMVKVKTIIWKMQKFLTFRMWSQQNQINSFMATAIESTFERYETKINQLEQKVARLEAERTVATPATPASPSSSNDSE